MLALWECNRFTIAYHSSPILSLWKCNRFTIAYHSSLSIRQSNRASPTYSSMVISLGSAMLNSSFTFTLEWITAPAVLVWAVVAIPLGASLLPPHLRNLWNCRGGEVSTRSRRNTACGSAKPVWMLAQLHVNNLIYCH